MRAHIHGNSQRKASDSFQTMSVFRVLKPGCHTGNPQATSGLQSSQQGQFILVAGVERAAPVPATEPICVGALVLVGKHGGKE